MTEYVIRYRRPGDIDRARRTTDGAKRTFTYEEARAWLKRNKVSYPNARIVEYQPRQPVKKLSRVEMARARMLRAR